MKEVFQTWDEFIDFICPDFHEEMTPGKTGFYHMPKNKDDLDAEILEVFEDVSAVATAIKTVKDGLNQKISDLQAQNKALQDKLDSIGAEVPPIDPIDFTPETDQLDKIHAALQGFANPNGDAVPDAGA